MATTTPNQENLVQKNKEYAESFDQGHLELPPSKKYAIVTCMDARIDPTSAFGIPLGSAHVIRNAGASARDALRSLVISQQLLGTNEIFVIKHTGCGMLTFDNDTGLAIVEKHLGREGLRELEELRGKDDVKFDFLTFGDLEEAVRRDVGFLGGSGLVGEGTVVSGWVYEVESGRVRRVV